MKTLISIALLLCSTALYAQEMVISTGGIPLGIQVRDTDSSKFIDIATLCDGFDDDGLPINLLIPFNSQIILFLPSITEENKDQFKRYGGSNRPRNIKNINYDYNGQKVGFLGSTSHSGGSRATLIIMNEKSIDPTNGVLKFDYRVDYGPVSNFEIYLVEEVEKIIQDAAKDPFTNTGRTYESWLEKSYADSLDKNGIPLNPVFPYGTESIIFSSSFSNSFNQIKVFGRKGGQQEVIKIPPGRNTVSIGDLKPGNYLITIENPFKKYDDKSTIFAFTIAGSFWHEGGYWLAICIPVLVVLFLLYRTFTRVKINRLDLTQKLSEAELKAIRAQLNPHFLFNALNAIQNLVNKQDTDTANDYIVKLSRLLRKVLSQSEDTLHALAEEVEMSTLYLELENMRTPFTYDISIASEVSQNMLVPSMILQPYLENAVIHGVVNGGASHIQLSVFHNEEACVLEVYDNGKGSSRNQGSGKGLNLGKERLEIISRQMENKMKASVLTRKLPEGGFRVTIQVPKDL